MAVLASSPGGHRLLGWRDWLVAGLVVWLAPLLPDAALVGLGWALGLTGPEAVGASQTLAILVLLGWVLLVAPALSWIGLLIAAPLAWLLLRHGLAGWLNMASLGAIAGVIATAALPGLHPLLPATFGALMLVLLRALLRARRPAAFTTC